MRDTQLVVSEVFGPTIQGEGRSTGQRAAFVRLGRCNLTCSWCDTPYTWDWKGANGTVYDPAKELTKTTVGRVVDTILPMAVKLVVITGGEPTLQKNGLYVLADTLYRDANIARVEVETNGTIAPMPLLLHMPFVMWNCSPKLSNAGMPYATRIKPKVLQLLASTNRAIFKFVVQTPADLEEVDALVDAIPLPASTIWLMPEGRTTTELAARQWLAQVAIDRGYNLSGRFHVQLWGDQRGH